MSRLSSDMLLGILALPIIAYGTLAQGAATSTFLTSYISQWASSSNRDT